MMKPIKDFEGYYITEDGRVWSEKRKKFLTPYIRRTYLTVTLSKESKLYTKLIHRLIAEAFIPNPNNLPQVNHKNENKCDNRIENLEWCTAEYNCNYGTRNARMAKSKLNGNSKRIIQYDLNGAYIKEWPSVRQIERDLGFNQAAVSRVALGKQKTAYGYKWRYNLT